MAKSMWFDKLCTDFEETVKFMEKVSINEEVSAEDRNVLGLAYEKVSHDFDEIKSSNGIIVENYRSNLEKELSDVVDKVSNLTIKDGYLRHKHSITGHKNEEKKVSLSTLISEYVAMCKTLDEEQELKKREREREMENNTDIFKEVEYLLANRDPYVKGCPCHDPLANMEVIEQDDVDIGDSDRGKQIGPNAIPEDFSFGPDPEWMIQQFNLHYFSEKRGQGSYFYPA